VAFSMRSSNIIAALAYLLAIIMLDGIVFTLLIS